MTDYSFDTDGWLGPGPYEQDFYEVMALIVAEFKSDPMSVQCFDARTVDRAKALVEDYDKRHRRYFQREASAKRRVR